MGWKEEKDEEDSRAGWSRPSMYTDEGEDANERTRRRYVTCELFNKNFVHNFVAVVILLAADFWITKNIGGRLLVGLRYWNEIDELGESKWRFECRDEEGMKRVDKHESRLFWTTLYVAVLVWTVFFIGTIAAFKPKYALLAALAIVLAASNLYGYTQCSKDAKEQIASFARRQVVGAFFS